MADTDEPRTGGFSSENVRPIPRRIFTPSSPAHSELSEDGSIRGVRLGLRGGGSSTGNLRTAMAGSSEVSPLLAAIRREVEAAEDRLGMRIARIERHTDQFREAADRIARQEEKLADAEATQMQYDRRLAELGGSLKGITEELQTLVKRVGGLDSRIWESQRHSEELFRTRAGELEQDLQAIAQASRIAATGNEDYFRRLDDKLQRAQGLVDSLTDGHTRQSRRMEVAEAQLELLSDSRSRAANADGAGGASAEVVARLQQEAAVATEAAEKAAATTERLAAEVRRAQSRAQEQEAQMASLLSKVHAQDAQIRRLLEADGGAPRSVSGLGLTEERPVDRRISALEEKLLGRKGLRNADVSSVNSEAGVNAEAAGAAVLELRAEVASLAEKLAAQSRAFEEVQHTLSDGHLQAPKPGTAQSLSVEVRSLIECIAAGEAAVRSLAPRLLSAAANGDLKLSGAARELEACCAEGEMAEATAEDEEEAAAASQDDRNSKSDDLEEHGTGLLHGAEDEDEKPHHQDGGERLKPRKRLPRDWLLERLSKGAGNATCWQWLPLPGGRGH